MNPFSFRGFLLAVAVIAVLPLPSKALAQQQLPPSFSPGFSEGSPWSHLPTGLFFPVKVAGFSRGNALQYDETGLDVSVGYNFHNPRIVATFYVYPTGGLTLEQEFKRRQEEITTLYPAAKLVSTDEIRVSPKKTPVLRAQYDVPRMFKSIDEPMRSILLVGPCGKNYVEYRISYPVSGGETAEKAVTRFLQDFAWSAKAETP